MMMTIPAIQPGDIDPFELDLMAMLLLCIDAWDMRTDLELDDIAEGTAKVVKPDGSRAGTSAATALGMDNVDTMMLIEIRNEAHRIKRVMAFILLASLALIDLVTAGRFFLACSRNADVCFKSWINGFVL